MPIIATCCSRKRTKNSLLRVLMEFQEARTPRGARIPARMTSHMERPSIPR